MAEDWKKKYQGSLEIVRRLHSEWTSAQNPAAKEIEEAFPELSESEEDKVKDALIACVDKVFEEYSVFGHTTKEQLLAWINKQERIGWTEYDESRYTELRIFIQCYEKDIETKKRLLEWIETLRPYFILKPSKKQMHALELVLNTHVFSNEENKKLVESLYNDLKKLNQEYKKMLRFSVGDIIKRKDSAVKYEVTRIADGEFQLDGGHWLDIRKMSEFELVK